MSFSTASTSTICPELAPAVWVDALEAAVVEPAPACADVDGALAPADAACAPPPKILDMMFPKMLISAPPGQAGPRRQQKRHHRGSDPQLRSAAYSVGVANKDIGMVSEGPGIRYGRPVRS